MEGLFLMQLFSDHLFQALFLALMVSGDAALVPAAYGVAANILPFWKVVAIIVIATSIADVFWYLLASNVKKERLFSLPILRKNREKVDQLSVFFKAHSLRALYLSKFIYGTRVATQVLAGVHRTPFLLYMLANVSGTASWTLVLMLVALISNMSRSALGDFAYALPASLLIFVLLVGILYWLSVNYSKRFGRHDRCN